MYAFWNFPCDVSNVLSSYDKIFAKNASFSDNCSHHETDNVRRQLSVDIFAPKRSYCYLAIRKEYSSLFL